MGALERDVKGKETRLSGQTGPVAAGGGRGALLMEGPEAAGNARWPIRHELGRRLIGWRVRMMSEVCRLPATPPGRERQGAQPGEGASAGSPQGQPLMCAGGRGDAPALGLAPPLN